MSTQNQIEANRANAQLCTGPKTPEGKARSSQNALKTGLHAKTEILFCENRAEYDELIAGYYRRFAPATDEERALLDTLITSEWLLRRYRAADACVINRANAITKAGSFGQAITSRTEALTLTDRRLNSAQRNYDKALKHLIAIRQLHGRPPLPAPEPAIEPEPEPSPAQEPLTDPAPPTENLVSFPHSSLPADPTPAPAAPPTEADDLPIAA